MDTEMEPDRAEPRPAPDFSPETIASRILARPALARVRPWGVREYGEVLALQERLREARRAETIPDTWLAGEHPTVITQGVRGQGADLVFTDRFPVFKVDRGGMTTLHNPGQLVIYPILRVQGGLLAQARVSLTLLTTIRDWLAELTGVGLTIHKGRPGLFHGERKVAAIGISIHGHVTMHGIAINLCNDLSPWQAIVPCGEPSTRPINVSEIIGRKIEPADLLGRLPEWIGRVWGYERVEVAPDETAF